MGAAEDTRGALRVVVADDSVLIRQGVIRLLEASGCEVVGEAADATGLLEVVARKRPDVAVVDIRMPPTHTREGVEAAGEIRRRHPETGVLVLSQYLEPRYAAQVLREAPGGLGYVLKDSISRRDMLVAAARRVAEGGTVVDPDVVRQMVTARRASERLERLSRTERTVVEMVAQGLSNGGIAEQLVVSVRTVETHVRSALDKLGVGEAPDANRRVRLVLEFLQDRAATQSP
jgi:DNA-binding NarL/FixJ family response regulator